MAQRPQASPTVREEGERSEKAARAATAERLGLPVSASNVLDSGKPDTGTIGAGEQDAAEVDAASGDVEETEATNEQPDAEVESSSAEEGVGPEQTTEADPATAEPVSDSGGPDEPADPAPEPGGEPTEESEPS